MQIGNGLQAKLGQPILCHHQTGGCGIILLAGIACCHHAALYRAKGAKRLHGRIGAVAFILFKKQHFAFFLRYRHRHQLVGKFTLGPGPRGILMAAHGIGIASLTADAIILGEILGCLNHAADHAEALLRLAHQPSACQPVVQHHITGLHTAAQLGGIMFDIGHALTPAGNDHISDARLHHHCGIDHRLQA